MARFDRQIASAKRLIEKNGEKCIWRSIPAETPADPDKPWNGGTNVPVESDVFICFVPVRNRDSRQFIEALAGTEVQIGKLAGLMGNVPFEPNLNDVVIRNGVELRMTTIDLLSPNGQKILYTLEFVG